MFFLEGIIIGGAVGSIVTLVLTLNFCKVKIAKIEERHKDCWEAFVSLNKKDGP